MDGVGVIQAAAASGTVLHQFDSEDDYTFYWDDNHDDENYYDDESWGIYDGSQVDPASATAESQYYQQEEAATEEPMAEESSQLGETVKGKGKGYDRLFLPWSSGGKGKGKSKGFRRSFGKGKGKDKG